MKKKTNKAGLYNLLALLINETLTPNSFDKVSNSDADTLKFLIKVVKNGEFTVKLYSIFTERIRISDARAGDEPIGLPEDLSETDETEQQRSSETGT